MRWIFSQCMGLGVLWGIFSRRFSLRTLPTSLLHYDQTDKCSDYIAHLDGSTEIDGGWINHNYIQLGYQLADSVSGLAYSFVGSCIILLLINLIPGLGLRAPEENEVMGIDDAEIGEFAVRSSFSPRSR